MPSGVDVETPVILPPPKMECVLEGEAAVNKVLKQEEERKARVKAEEQLKKANDSALDESVEVVLNEQGSAKVVDLKTSPDQNVFRHPQAVRPRAMRAPVMTAPVPQHHHHHYPYGHHGSGSWGYGPPLPPEAYHVHPPPSHPHAPYPVPSYPASSNSFDDQAYHHHSTHYSPHIQYPAPAPRYPAVDEVNVISPNHKGDPHYRPPITPRSRSVTSYYQYPPTSPVSRPGQGPPRLRSYAIRRGQEGSYSRAQRPEYDDAPCNAYGHPLPPPPPTATASSNRGAKSGVRLLPPVVAESFDSTPRSRASSSHGTPKSTASKPLPPPQSSDPHMQFYGGGGSWGSFDSVAGPPPHFDDQRYYGFPPDSPYSPYHQQYSPAGLYQAESFPSPHAGYGPPPLPPTFSYSYDDEERYLHDYHPDHDGDQKYVTPPGASAKKNRSKSSTPVASNISSRNSLLPKAAEEIDFEVADPPLEPITPESNEPSCESLADVNPYDVLCGRGGGTNSQVGNRRFRQLVQEFQPIYLMAKRKEKPLLARTIVLIIRKRGGRFLKKNEESGELFEVGDLKAEAKTSQALREGLDVRATKSAANAMSKKDKKIKSPGSAKQDSDSIGRDSAQSRPTDSPPTLPRLQGEEVQTGAIHPHSPEPNQFRKRRRIRSADRFFNDFMPPRADINNRPDEDEGAFEDDDDDINTTPIRRNGTRDEEDYQDCGGMAGCAGIALDIVTGAAKGSFCLGPSGWRR